MMIPFSQWLTAVSTAVLTTLLCATQLSPDRQGCNLGSGIPDNCQPALLNKGKLTVTPPMLTTGLLLVPVLVVIVPLLLGGFAAPAELLLVLPALVLSVDVDCGCPAGVALKGPA